MHEILVVVALFVHWQLAMPTVPSKPRAEAVQFSLEMLTQKEQKDLSLSIFYLAHFEARLENCGFYPRVEQRAVAALKRCVKAESIDRLVSFFRMHKTATLKLIAESKIKPDKERIDCAKPSEKAWLQTLKPIIERDLRALDRMC